MATPVGNSAANASGNGPATGYLLKLLLFTLFMLIYVISINLCTNFISLFQVIEILLVYTFSFGIKLYPKLPYFLTIKVTPYSNLLVYHNLENMSAWIEDREKKVNISICIKFFHNRYYICYDSNTCRSTGRHASE